MRGYAKREHKLEKVLSRLDSNIRTGMELWGEQLVEEMQKRAPVLTGTTERSVGKAAVQGSNGHYILRVGPTTPYARFIELPRYTVGRMLGRISQMKGASMPWMIPSARDPKILMYGHRMVAAAIAAALRR